MKKLVLLLGLFVIYTSNLALASDTEWWNKYGDEVLVGNLEKVYVQNPDLKIAALKTKQMQEVVKMAFANELPQIGFDPNISWEIRSSDVHFGNVIIPDYSQGRCLLPLAMSYEIDLYGKNHLQTKSYKKMSEMTIQDEQMARIFISSSFSANYFNLLRTDRLIQNSKKLVELQQEIAKMQRIKYEKGLCGEPEVLSEEQTLTMFKEDLNNLESEQEVIKNQLITLIGEKNLKDIERNKIENIKIFDVPEYLDSSVITKRPDFIKSELYIQKTGLDARVARRELLPSFTVYGNVGFNAYSLNRLFTNRSFLSTIGILPSWDVFTGGRKMANLRYRKLESKKAVEEYNKTILTCLQELNNSLFRIKSVKKNYNESTRRNELEETKFALTKTKLKIGATSMLDEMKEERNLYMRENEAITQKANYLVMTIELYKALGGQDYTSENTL